MDRKDQLNAPNYFGLEIAGAPDYPKDLEEVTWTSVPAGLMVGINCVAPSFVIWLFAKDVWIVAVICTCLLILAGMYKLISVMLLSSCTPIGKMQQRGWIKKLGDAFPEDTFTFNGYPVEDIGAVEFIKEYMDYNCQVFFFYDDGSQIPDEGEIKQIFLDLIDEETHVYNLNRDDIITV